MGGINLPTLLYNGRPTYLNYSNPETLSTDIHYNFPLLMLLAYQRSMHSLVGSANFYLGKMEGFCRMTLTAYLGQDNDHKLQPCPDNHMSLSSPSYPFRIESQSE